MTMDALTRIHQAVISIESELSDESEALVQQYISEIRHALAQEWSRHIHAEDA